MKEYADGETESEITSFFFFFVHVGSQTCCTVNVGAVKLDGVTVFVILPRLALLTAVNHVFRGVGLAGSQSTPPARAPRSWLLPRVSGMDDVGLIDLRCRFC